MRNENIIRLFDGDASINELNSNETTKMPCKQVMYQLKELRVTALKKNTKKRVLPPCEGRSTFAA